MPLSPYLLNLRDHKLGKKVQEPKKAKKRIAKKGAKGKIDDREYKKIVKEMLAEDNKCEMKTPVCTEVAQGLHHKKKRGMNLLKRKYLLRSCNACNTYVEAHPQYAIDHELSISKHSIEKS